MRKSGYDPAFSAAVNAAASPAGMLIPPSNTFIVYSLVSSTSIAALFMAGVFPGLLWALVCVVVVALYARKRPELRSTAARPTLKQALIVFLKALPALLMIFVVVGGILAGFFTATESAVIAVLYSLALGLIQRTLPIKALPAVILEASKVTGIVMLLIGMSGILGYVLANVAYFAAIPKKDLAESEVIVAGLFFRNVFGSGAAARSLPAFVALSNLGNVLAVSFAHARFNQELAKEGLLPASRFWASNKPFNAPAPSVSRAPDRLWPSKLTICASCSCTGS